MQEGIGTNFSVNPMFFFIVETVAIMRNQMVIIKKGNHKHKLLKNRSWTTSKRNLRIALPFY